MVYLALILIVVGVALFVASPLFETARAGRGGADLERSRLEHERALAVQGLRDLEFDREMRKLSEQDWAELKSRLEARALRAMAALEKLDRQTGMQPAAPRKRLPRAAEAAGGRFCPACGAAVNGQYNFCAGCGAALANPPDALSHG